MKKFWFSLPGWAQGVIAVAATASVVGIGIKTYLVVNAKLNPTNDKEEADAASQEVKDLAKKGMVVTLTQSQLQTLANQIETAFNGPTEDEQAVYKAFTNVKNNADVLALKSTFGTRKTGYYAALGVYWSYFNGTLSQTIQHYFDPSEIAALNSLLSKKGITYLF